MRSFDAYFTILDLTDTNGYDFSLLIENATGSVVNHNTQNFRTNINRTSAKAVPVSDRRSYVSIVRKYFADKPNVHKKAKNYFISPSSDLKGVKIHNYKLCSICNDHFLKRPIVDHVIKCAARINGDHLSRTAASSKTLKHRGFQFITEDKEILYVIIKDSVTNDSVNREPIQDAFIRNMQLWDFFNNKELAMRSPVGTNFNVPLRKALLGYFEQQGNISYGDDITLRMFRATNTNNKLTFKTNDEYSKYVAPILHLLAVLDASFSCLLEDLDLNIFNKLMFEKICSPDSGFTADVMKAIYCCFVDPLKNSFRGQNYTCNMFRAIKRYFMYTAYDGLLSMSEYQPKMFICYSKNILALESVSKINNDYHKMLLQNDNIMRGVDDVNIGGACYSVKFIQSFINSLFVEYKSTVNSYLQENARDIDDTMNFFCSKVKDDHSNTQHGYTPFESKILESKQKEYITSFKNYMKEGTETYTLDRLLYLSNLVCLMVELSIGFSYIIPELGSIRYRNVGTMGRTLFFNSTRRTFNISLTHKVGNNPTQVRNSSYRTIPEKVSSFMVHVLFVVRPIVISLFETSVRHSTLAEKIDDDLIEVDRETIDDELNEDLETIMKSYVFITNSGRITSSHFTGTLSKLSVWFIKQKWVGRSLIEALDKLVRQTIATLYSGDFLRGTKQATCHGEIYLRYTAVNSSKIWHRQLGFGSSSTRGDQISTAPHSYKLSRKHGFISLTNLAIAGKLLLGEDFSFFSQEVEEACRHIYSTLDRVMVNTASGSGKSLTYILPAMLEKKTGLPYMTVVVVPFASLLNYAYDTKDHLNVGIYDNKSDGSAYDETDILFVQIEQYSKFLSDAQQFDSPKFSRYIRRIVVDEFHVLEQDYSYRSSLLDVKESFDLPYSFVFLSATVNDQIFLSIQNKSDTQTKCFPLSVV